MRPIIAFFALVISLMSIGMTTSSEMEAVDIPEVPLELDLAPEQTDVDDPIVPGLETAE